MPVPEQLPIVLQVGTHTRPQLPALLFFIYCLVLLLLLDIHLIYLPHPFIRLTRRSRV